MRKYAENLVGDLDRSYYNTQRDVANKTYQTNWDNLQNQYKNLQEKLKIQQEQANKDFANGLVNVSDDSFSRMQGVNQNLANRGLTTSGTRDLFTQADTKQKGSDVRNLLGKSNNVAIDIANQLSEANQKYATNQAELQAALGDALAGIGDAETAAQNEYNNALAGIAEAAANRKAANAAASAGSGNKYDEDLEDMYRKQGIYEILVDDTLTESEKSDMLRIMYGIGNSYEVIKAYEGIAGADERREKAIKSAQDEYDKALKAYQNYNKNKKEKPGYDTVISPGQPGYNQQKSQITSDPYAKRKDLVSGTSSNGNVSRYTPTAEEAQAMQDLYEQETANSNMRDKLGYYSTVPGYSSVPTMGPSSSTTTKRTPTEAEIKLQELNEANNRLQEARMKDYSEDLYDLYELLYGGK